MVFNQQSSCWRKHSVGTLACLARQSPTSSPAIQSLLSGNASTAHDRNYFVAAMAYMVSKFLRLEFGPPAGSEWLTERLVDVALLNDWVEFFNASSHKSEIADLNSSVDRLTTNLGPAGIAVLDGEVDEMKKTRNYLYRNHLYRKSKTGHLRFDPKNPNGVSSEAKVEYLKNLFLVGEIVKTQLVFISSCSSEASGNVVVAAGVPHVGAVKHNAGVTASKQSTAAAVGSAGGASSLEQNVMDVGDAAGSTITTDEASAAVAPAFEFAPTPSPPGVLRAIDMLAINSAGSAGGGSPSSPGSPMMDSSETPAPVSGGGGAMMGGGVGGAESVTSAAAGSNESASEEGVYDGGSVAAVGSRPFCRDGPRDDDVLQQYQDGAPREFATVFYDALFENGGRSTVKQAFDMARNCVNATHLDAPKHEEDLFLLLPRDENHDVGVIDTLPEGKLVDETQRLPPRPPCRKAVSNYMGQARVQKVVRLLLDEKAACVTVTGEPGSGKTELAVQACDYVRDRHHFNSFLWADYDKAALDASPYSSVSSADPFFVFPNSPNGASGDRSGDSVSLEDLCRQIGVAIGMPQPGPSTSKKLHYFIFPDTDSGQPFQKELPKVLPGDPVDGLSLKSVQSKAAELSPEVNLIDLFNLVDWYMAAWSDVAGKTEMEGAPEDDVAEKGRVKWRNAYLLAGGEGLATGSDDEGVQRLHPSLVADDVGLFQVFTWCSHFVLLLAALQRGSEPYDRAAPTRVSRGKSGAWPSHMIGVIAAAGFVPGVAAMENPGECLESAVSALLHWLCHAHWSFHALIFTLAGLSVYTSVVFSIREMKAGKAEFAAAWRESFQSK